MTARRDVTEQAAVAAIEQGCRMLRLPTIRDRFADIAAAAERQQQSYLGFLSELVIAECDDRDRRRAARRVHDAGFPRPKRLEEFSKHHLQIIKQSEHVVRRAYHDELRREARMTIVSQSRQVIMMQTWDCAWYGDCREGLKQQAERFLEEYA